MWTIAWLMHLCCMPNVDYCLTDYPWYAHLEKEMFQLTGNIELLADWNIQGASPNGCHPLSELRRIRRNRNSILNRFPLKTSLHCLLWFTYVTFLFHWSLSLAGSCFSWYQISFVFFIAYIWNIQWTWSLFICILCRLLRSVGCLYICIPLHSSWWFRMPLDCELSGNHNLFHYIH